MEKNVIELLKELINIPTYKGTDQTQITDFIKSIFGSCAEIVEVKDKNGRSHFIIGVNTDLKDLDDCILLSGHIDTVAPSENHEPSAKQEKGIISGLGSADMKPFFASIASQLGVIKTSSKPVVISITTDEETDLLGIKTVIEELNNRNIKPAFTIVGEPSGSKLSLENKGNAVFISKMQGKACHSSTPELGINAIYLSARMALGIEELAKKYAGVASISVTIANGGTAPNVIPDSCMLKISVRCSNVKMLEQITEELQTLQSSISTSEGSFLLKVFEIPPFEKKNNSYVEKLSESSGIETAASKFTTEAGYIQQSFGNSEIVIYGPGDPDCIHKSSECVNEDELVEYAKDLSQIIFGYTNYARKLNGGLNEND